MCVFLYCCLFSPQSLSFTLGTEEGGAKVADLVGVLFVPLLLRPGGPSAFVSAALCVFSKFKESFSIISLLSYWTQGLNLLFYLNMFVILCCILGAHYFPGTINCSGYYCTSESSSVLPVCEFHVSLCFKWWFIVCSPWLFVSFGSSIFWGHLNIPCPIVVTKAECHFGGNLWLIVTSFVFKANKV